MEPAVEADGAWYDSRGLGAEGSGVVPLHSWYMRSHSLTRSPVPHSERAAALRAAE